MIVHILKMCTSYFVHIIQGFFFSVLRGVELRYFPSKMLRGGLVFVICSSKSFCSFSFKLHNDCLHMKMCTFYFVHIFRFFLFFSFLRGVELRHFSVQNAYMVPGL